MRQVSRPVDGRLVVVGLNHRTAPLGLRECLAVSGDLWHDETSDLPSVLLMTCNRVEVYAWSVDRASTTIRRLVRSLARVSGVPRRELAPYLVTFVGRDALHHLIRVIAGLDSLVLGEEHIRGQVRDAYKAAKDCRALPSPLDGVFSRALEAGKRIRGGSMLGRHPSVATSSVHLAQHLMGPRAAEIATAGAIVLGAGAMAKSAAHALQQAGARLTLVNRTPAHAEALARELGPGTRVAALDELPRLLDEAVLLVAATASRLPVVSENVVREAMARRADRPLMIVDVSVPRDVEPSVRGIPGVQLLDVDDLKQYCPVGEEQQASELLKADALVEREVLALERWLRVRAVSPAIVELRDHAERIRRAELRRSAPRLKNLSVDELAAIDRLTESIVKQLLHGPTVALREAADNPRGVDRSVVAVHRVLRFDTPRRRRGGLRA